MVTVYDLYDLSAVFKNIRMCPMYEKNAIIIKNVIDILKNDNYAFDDNQFRRKLRKIENINTELYEFVLVNNRYVYVPGVLKDKYTYDILLNICRELLVAFEEENLNKIIDLADCVHNLPIQIADNEFAVPKSFWKCEVKYYRNKWNKHFLR